MSKPIVVIVCMVRSSESWEPQQRPHPWHRCAGGGAVHSITNGLMRRSKRHLQSPILTAQEQACFASSGAQKRSINGHFAVIFEKPRVAVQAQNFCFKSPILRPL